MFHWDVVLLIVSIAGISVALYAVRRYLAGSYGKRAHALEEGEPTLPEEPKGFFHKAQDRVLIFDNIMADRFGNSKIISWAIPGMVGRGVRVVIMTGPDVLVTSHAILRAIKDYPDVEFYLIPQKQRVWFQVRDEKGRWNGFRHRRFITKDGHATVIDAPPPLFLGFLNRRRSDSFLYFDFHVRLTGYYEHIFAKAQKKALRVDTHNLVAFIKTHGQWVVWNDGPVPATAEQIVALAARLGEVLEPEEQLVLSGVLASS